MVFGNCADSAVKSGDAGKNFAAGAHQRFEDRYEFWSDRQFASDDLRCPAFGAANPFAEHYTNRLQQSSDLILKLYTHADERVARRQHCPVNIAANLSPGY